MPIYLLQKIDELLLSSYKYLTADDECYFFMGYTPIHIALNAENDLMMNFKKAMNTKGTSQWKWKGAAIDKISDLFIQNIQPILEPNAILVPVPPSKIKGDILYDDRLIQVITKYCAAHQNAELREIIYATETITPTHEEKKTPEELLEVLKIDKNLCQDKKDNIIIVDDVLRDGAHFKACKSLLQPEFPNANIKGLFIARTQH